MLLHNRKPLGTVRGRILTIAAAGVAVAIALTGCSSSGSGSGGSSNLSITFLPKSLGNAYFNTSDKAGGAAVKSFGGTYAEVAPSVASANAQIPFINTLTQKKVGAIVLSSDDISANCSAIKKAQSAGVKVVTFDSDTKPGCRDLFVNQADAEGIAQTQVAMMVSDIGKTGDIAILSSNPTDTNQNAWNELMKKEIAAKYPGLNIVTTAYATNDPATALSKTAGLLQAYPNLKGIISPTTIGVAAAAQYVSTSTYKGKVAVTGLGTPNQMRPYVKDGTVKAFALWNPGNLGKLAAYAAKALIQGKITGKKGDTFTAGSLGKFTVGADNTVLLGKPTVFDSSNIDSFNF